ncbi:endonuclease/exonuclease/phosphatase family protein [Cyclobacterium jeungdonense]|uniref:Endonuclease/exonuclease/phosphatase family protein n=1 Tax=Cyclobacterium jeungdonense TaxID=708087 RepID=A0ABT8C3U4_9BACT|nr:endonuclease/exonuclease/phosphatase family protein [Cyclobacterium jeungdonense]MDN3687460.1 endonuclease/exonuclease/phosphatase family protein [Cyclobacterium jeungdonense]
MNHLLASIFTGFFFIMGIPNSNFQQLKVVNLNLRYDNPDDGKNKWENRLPIVEAFFDESTPHLLGFQEVTHRQLLDLKRIMPNYDYVGKGREDGLKGGEYNPIFFRKDRFQLLESGTFWLSNTPEKPGSIGWDAQLPRIVTWAKLEDLKSGKIIFHFNTHFDNKGIDSRYKSVDLLAGKIEEISEESPVVVTGDFNIRKDHPRYGKQPYIYLVATLSRQLQMESAEFAAEKVISAGATGNGFEENWQQRPPNAVDYIFVNEGFAVNTYEVRHIIREGVFIADHWPVIVKMRFSN